MDARMVMMVNALVNVDNTFVCHMRELLFTRMLLCDGDAHEIAMIREAMLIATRHHWDMVFPTGMGGVEMEV